MILTVGCRVRSNVGIHFRRWASGHTAPEIIAARADAAKDNMGLTSFKGAKVRKSDVTVAKNYMDHEEISTLNRIVNMYLDELTDGVKKLKS